MKYRNGKLDGRRHQDRRCCNDKNCPGAKSVVEILPHRGATTAIRAKSEEQGDDEMVSYLLKLLDGTLVNSTALVDQVACIVL
jgi:hypothetical protein